MKLLKKIKKQDKQAGLIVGLIPVFFLWIIDFPRLSDLFLAIIESIIIFVLFFFAGAGLFHYITLTRKKWKKFTLQQKNKDAFLITLFSLLLIFFAVFLIIATTY